MKQRRESIRKWIPALLSVLLVFGVLTVFGACGMKDDGTWMKCHGAQTTVAKLGGAMLIVQFKAFAQCLTPYPSRAKWFNTRRCSLRMPVTAKHCATKTIGRGGDCCDFLLQYRE